MTERDKKIFQLKSDIKDAREKGRWEVAIKLQSKLKLLTKNRKKK